MPRKVFLSHSTADLPVIEDLTMAIGHEKVWLDKSDIHLGSLLGKEIIRALRHCRAVILVWSAAASRSPWVQTEWIAAVNLDLPILPITIDATPLPQCLVNTVRVPEGQPLAQKIRQAAKATKKHLPRSGSISPPMLLADEQLDDAVFRLSMRQYAVLTALEDGDRAKAQSLQNLLDPDVGALLEQHPLDPRVTTLWAYNAKNDVLLERAGEISAGVRVADERLVESQWRFLHSLWLNPVEPSALNGLATIAWFAHDLDTAEFFILAALRQAPFYSAAQQDLQMVRKLRHHT